jgi:hypothetical protein
MPSDMQHAVGYSFDVLMKSPPAADLARTLTPHSVMIRC